jgi:F0F1-type ATP synthase assembly protein I
METNRVDGYKRIGTGLALILSPLAFMIGFGIHPLEGHTAASAFQTVIDNQGRWAAAHILLLIAAALLIPAAIGVMHRLGGTRPWFGAIGASLVGFGAVFLGSLIGAEALATSAFATVPADQRVGLLPGAQAILDSKGAMGATFLAFAMLLGLLILGIGLVLSGAASRWVGALTIIAALVMTVGAIASERIAAIGSVPLLVGFGYLGWETLRMPTVGPQGAQTAAGPGVRPARA